MRSVSISRTNPTFVVAPSLVKNGLAFGKSISKEYPLVSYYGLSFSDPEQYITAPSPRYWLLWPGVMIMLLYSFADVILSVIPIVKGLTIPFPDCDRVLNLICLQGCERGVTSTPETGSRSLNLMHTTKIRYVDMRHRIKRFTYPLLQTPIQDRIPTLWWTTGLALSTIMSCAILATLFHMNVGEALLSLVLGFLFSFIGVQSSGHTDVNPISTVAKVDPSAPKFVHPLTLVT